MWGGGGPRRDALHGEQQRIGGQSGAGGTVPLRPISEPRLLDSPLSPSLNTRQTSKQNKNCFLLQQSSKICLLFSEEITLTVTPYRYQCVYIDWTLRDSEKESLAPRTKLQTSCKNKHILVNRILLGSCLCHWNEVCPEVWFISCTGPLQVECKDFSLGQYSLRIGSFSSPIYYGPIIHKIQSIFRSLLEKDRQSSDSNIFIRFNKHKMSSFNGTESSSTLSPHFAFVADKPNVFLTPSGPRLLRICRLRLSLISGGCSGESLLFPLLLSDSWVSGSYHQDLTKSRICESEESGQNRSEEATER